VVSSLRGLCLTSPAASDLVYADRRLAGESLPHPPVHPQKGCVFVLISSAESKGQTASGHLRGPVAGPDVLQSSPSESCPPVSGSCHCTPGSQPREGTPKTRRYARGCPARALSVGPAVPPGVSLAAALACFTRACSVRLLTMLCCLLVVQGAHPSPSNSAAAVESLPLSRSAFTDQGAFLGA
jgi:hypothetical protein